MIKLIIVSGISCCSSFLISVCMFIEPKVFLIPSATEIVRAWGAIWLNPGVVVVYTVCSADGTESCVLYSCCVGVFAVM